MNTTQSPNRSHRDLSGRVALVTGGSRGLGAAICTALAEAGAAVAVNYLHSQAEAKDIAEAIIRSGGKASALKADVSKAAEVTHLVAATEQALGAVDILINNAGIIRPQKIENITEADWDDLIDVNLKSAFLCCQAVLPGMRARRWGRIVQVSSLAAQVGGLVGPHYSASKAGMLGLTHAYATLLVREGITVNAVAPALVATDMVRDNPNVKPEMVPVGRFGTPEEHADAVVMLARNGYITGQTLNVNGGMYFS